MAETESLSHTWGWVTIRAFVSSIRPRQWTKNLIIYFAFFFTIDQAWSLNELSEAGRLFSQTTIAFVVFCIITSAVYLLNDVLDSERDRHHPIKRRRPIAAGVLSPYLALSVSLVMAIGGISLAFILDAYCGLVVMIYLAIMIAYNLYLKRIIIVDVATISAGFVLRAATGAVVLDVTISPWLYVCTSLGALFLGFAKRLNERVLAGDGGSSQRESLEEYTPPFLKQLIAIVAPATLVSYILYTFTADDLPDNHAMMLTIPFVMYGLFRYIYLVHHKNLGENPEDLLLRDTPLIINIALWLVTASAVLLAYR